MPLDRLRNWRRLGWMTAAFMALIASFFLDSFLARGFRQPIESNQTLAILTDFKCWGDGVAIVTIALAIGMVSPKHRRSAVLIVAAVLVAASIADGFKWISDRKRPFEMDELAASGPIWESDGGSNSSFPSGHVASAFAFAHGVGTLFPPAMPLCIVAASGTAVSRMVKERHFLSDCIGGAILGWSVMGLIFHLEWLFVRRFLAVKPSVTPTGSLVPNGDPGESPTALAA